MNQIKVKMLMEKNGVGLNDAMSKLQINSTSNNSGNSSSEKKEDDVNSKYRWQHKSSSPTQVKSIPTNLDEKMDPKMLNDTYFMSSCGNDTKDVIALSEQKQNDGSKTTKNLQFADKTQKSGLTKSSKKDDRGQFVMVPAMATRSDISALSESNDEHSQNSNDESNGNSSGKNKAIEDNLRRAQMMSKGFEEVFWPMENID